MFCFVFLHPFNQNILDLKKCAHANNINYVALTEKYKKKHPYIAALGYVGKAQSSEHNWLWMVNGFFLFFLFFNFEQIKKKEEKKRNELQNYNNFQKKMEYACKHLNYSEHTVHIMVDEK